jgi:hypothetical protein
MINAVPMDPEFVISSFSMGLVRQPAMPSISVCAAAPPGVDSRTLYTTCLASVPGQLSSSPFDLDAISLCRDTWAPSNSVTGGSE